MQRILMIDNYDSFTYNLVQYFGELGCKIEIFRNDQISVEKIKRMKFDKIVISPGPGRPENAGISVELIKEFEGKKAILGVCLGHQCIGYLYGGTITGARYLMHGKTSLIYHRAENIFKNVVNPFSATRYHSLVIEKKTLPDVLAITAWSDDGEIMGICHRKYSIFGVQFHPESVLTDQGKKILKNFLQL
ncbi:MAG TPA: aminodeoxychorismate/anthranilate synthase component II [bacterium]|nr:aminodeoxychorismate/anthranilate synthase component II [bacterium]HOL34478.1 aminodeoxychorismate/anthranilate synthase component II [bacterium]HPP08464.1 aminodeoxychorismate/anthranilate synthase component II [bacterium]